VGHTCTRTRTAKRGSYSERRQGCSGRFATKSGRAVQEDSRRVYPSETVGVGASWYGWYARRPLQIDEVAEAVAINAAADPILSPEMRLFRRENILKICPNFTQMVTIQTAEESFEAVSLVHSTVREYMDYELSHWNPHFEIARACLRYLCLLDRPDALSSPDYRQRFPLANYAARFWHYHMEQAVNSLK